MNRSVGVAVAAAALLLTGVAGAPAAPAGATVAAARPADGPSPSPSPPPLVTRRIDVEMRDTAFAPAAIQVNVGETIDFVFTNTGKQLHDAFIGDAEAQEHHEEEMRASKDTHDHAHAGGVIVQPGEKGSIRYFFDKPGTLEIGCHQPYHYGIGMKAVIEVAPGVPPMGGGPLRRSRVAALSSSGRAVARPGEQMPELPVRTHRETTTTAPTVSAGA